MNSLATSLFVRPVLAGLVFVLLLLGSGVAPKAFGQCFLPLSTYSAGRYPSEIVNADFNNDGKPDLAVVNYLSNNVSVFLNNGTGGFGATTNYGVGTTPQSLATGDFNADGKPDLAIANYNSDNVSILLGNGSGGFASAVNYAVTTRARATAVGDFNGDGKLDIVMAHNGLGVNNGTVSILPGNGDGTFGTAVGGFASGSFSADVAVGDLNGDTKPDLAVANIDGTVSVLLNTGSGSIAFGAATTVFSMGNPQWVVLQHLNGDTNLDLVVVLSGGTNVYVGFGTGSGGFGTFTSYAVGTNPSGVSVADFNNDSRPDLAVAYSNNVALLLNTGNSSFGSTVNLSVPGASYINIGDFNTDGKPDIATANSADSGVMSVLLSTSQPSPTITATPSLTITQGQTTTLTASAGSGPPATTYNWSNLASTTAITVSVAGPYTVTGVTGNCSGTATVIVSVTAAPPSVTAQPASASSVCEGTSVMVTVGVSGSISGYQWLKSGSPVAGQTTATLSLSNVQMSDGGLYSLSLTGPGGSTTSNGFTLTVNPFPAPGLFTSTSNGSFIAQATGGIVYERLKATDRINGYEIRQTEQNATGYFAIDRSRPFSITVIGANGCRAVVNGVAP